MSDEARRLINDMLGKAPGFSEEYIVTQLKVRHNIDPATTNTVLDAMVNEKKVVRRDNGSVSFT